MGKASRGKKERKHPGYVSPVKKQHTGTTRKLPTESQVAIVTPKHQVELVPATVGFCSKQIATGLTVPTNIISIRFGYDSPPTFAIEHKRLLSVALPVLERGEKIDEKVCAEIYDFVKECSDDTIVVHCGEGRIRSPAVANAIATSFGMKLSSRQMLGHTLGDSNMDRDIFCQLADYFEERLEQHYKEVDAAASALTAQNSAGDIT